MKPEFAANGMTAVYFPAGVTAADVVPQLLKHNIVVAGGLHKDIKGSNCPLSRVYRRAHPYRTPEKYFRIGHMGVTVADRSRGDLDKLVEGVKAVIGALPGSRNLANGHAGQAA